MDHGFKNVNLGNVYPKPNAKTTLYLNEEDTNLMCKYAKESLTLIDRLSVMLHF